MLLVGKRLIQVNSDVISKPFIDHFYDMNHIQSLFQIHEIAMIKGLVETKNIGTSPIPKILDANNIKIYLDMEHLMEIVIAHSKLGILIKFIKEYKQLKKETRLIDDNKINDEIQSILSEKLDNLSDLIQHDIQTSILLKKVKINV